MVSNMHLTQISKIGRALKIYCPSFYGSMLWDLSGEGASQVFSAWNTAIKLSWSCPRDTRTYLMQQVLCPGLDSAKTDILARYLKFFRSLRKSTSKEVSMMASLVSRDIRTTTGSNLRLLANASGLCPWQSGQLKFREAVTANELVEVMEVDRWRIPLLDKLLSQRQTMYYTGEEEELTRIDDLINSLCIN